MAQTTTQQQAPPRLEESIPTPESPVTPENPDMLPLPGQIHPLQDCGSLSWSERRWKWADSARRTPSAIRAVTVAILSNQSPFWRKAFPRIANTCGIIGFILAVVFGIIQWLAQDKSIAVAKESELITLALSCSDKEIKNTSVCQQFLEKYPDGPVISRREITSADYTHHNDSKGVKPMRTTLEDIAVRLEMMDRFIQKQNSRFQSVLNISDPLLSLAHMEDIVEDERLFWQSISSSTTTSASQREDKATLSLTSPLVAITRLYMGMNWLLEAVTRFLAPTAILILVIGVILIRTTEIALFLFLGFLACIVAA